MHHTTSINLYRTSSWTAPHLRDDVTRVAVIVTTNGGTRD